MWPRQGNFCLPHYFPAPEMWSITRPLRSIWTRFQAICCHTTTGCLLQGWPECSNESAPTVTAAQRKPNIHRVAAASHSEPCEWSLLTRRSGTLFVLVSLHLGASLPGDLVRLLWIIESSVADGWKTFQCDKCVVSCCKSQRPNHRFATSILVHVLLLLTVVLLTFYISNRIQVDMGKTCVKTSC